VNSLTVVDVNSLTVVDVNSLTVVDVNSLTGCERTHKTKSLNTLTEYTH
jgi:hypothetical protein